MAERLMPTQDLQSLQPLPFTGAVGELLASLSDGDVVAPQRIAATPPADPEEADEAVDEDDLDDDEDLDDEDDDVEDEDDDEEFEDDDDDDDVAEEEKEA